MKTTALLVMATVISAGLTAQPAEESLWPGKNYEENEFIPTVTFHLPSAEKAVDAAIVVCPGGGYGHLAMDHEGRQVAEWLNGLGITAVVLQYHVVRKGEEPGLHPAPLKDAQRAIRIVRSRAEKLGVDPGKIGILGFSAGGHLASTAATHFSPGNPTSGDAVERVSSRPDFAVLLYPVITLLPPYAHQGSRRNLLGLNPPDSLVLELSNERQVSSETPPVFLAHTTEDTGVPAQNSIMFYEALRKAGVPAEIHIFQKGRHGLGLGPKELAFSSWPLLCEKWMQAMDFLPVK